MKKYFYLIIILIIFSSCEKDVDIDIKEAPKQLVISSLFSNIPEDSYIVLTFSKGFERENNEYEFITGAQITVKDTQGNPIVFTADSNNVYKTSTPAVPGEKYTLDIRKDNFHLSAEENIPEIVTLQDFDIQRTDGNVKLILYFDDPQGQTDYYRIIVQTDTYNFSSNYDFLTTDFYYDSQTHSLELENLNIQSTGHFKVKLFHLNKKVYDYYETLYNLNEINYGDSPFESAVPGNPNTNVNGGIGYFIGVGESEVEKNISN